MSAPGHDTWADAVASYALGALPEAEVIAFEQHLAACGACRAELEHLSVAVAALPASVAPRPAPPALGDRIMADVRREAELLHAAGPAADRLPRRPARQHRRWTRAPRWAVPAAVTAALAVGFAAGALVRTGDERVVPVATTEAVRGTHARLLLGDDHATLVADHLPAPPAGRIYQVWLKPRDGEPEPTSALFVPRADGTATVALPARAADMELVMVSAEPPGGSAAPTTPPVLSARPRS